MQPRDIVAGRFEIDRLAGSGGMGAVYRAIDRRTGQPVALKVLHGHSGAHADRFAREARLLSELRHPGIVRFVGSGATDRGDGFIVMEWLEGESLSALLKRTSLPPGEVIALAARVADALRVAHERGIVHRDLKPQNLFLEGGSLERIKVLDFGIARILDPGQKLTITGAMLGTPGYMSPEQAKGDRDVDARTDVYALGCVMFRALTGRRVFIGEDAVTLLIKVAMEPAPRASSLCPVPPALDDLLARMLSIHPADRPRDASALLAELAVLGGWQQGATALVPPPMSGRPGGPSAGYGPTPASFLPAPGAPAQPGAPSGFAALAPSSFSPAPPPPPAPRAPAPPPGFGTGVQPGGMAPTWTATSAPGLAPTYASPGVAQTAGAYQPGPGAQPAPSRAPMLLLAGAVGALLVVALLLGALALCVMAPGAVSGPTAGAAGCPGEKCTSARLRDPARVDAVTALPQVKDFARDVDPGAQLVFINVVTTSNDGTIDVNNPKHVLQYHFQRAAEARFFVWLSGERLVLYRMNPVAGAITAPEPGCSASAAWRAALPSGVASGTVTTMQLLDTGPPLNGFWQISSGAQVAYVDPRSCVQKKLF